MSQNSENQPLQVAYVVTCYQNIIGVFASQDDACQKQHELINQNRPADVLCRPIIYPLNS